MELRKEERLRELREDAKWGRNEDVQKNAILELGRMGPDSFEALKEVMSVAVREDIKEACRQVINGVENTPRKADKGREEEEEEKNPQERKGGKGRR